jgi:hypothetical protein
MRTTAPLSALKPSLDNFHNRWNSISREGTHVVNHLNPGGEGVRMRYQAYCC